MMELLSCRLCDDDLKIDSCDTYKCSCCGSVFVKKAEDDFGEKFKGVLSEEKFARVSAARQNLWPTMHEEYINSSSCLEYAREHGLFERDGCIDVLHDDLVKKNHELFVSC